MQIICEDFWTKQRHMMDIGHLHNLIRYMHDGSDFQYNLLTVNLRDSKNKRCRDRDFSRLDILRVVETETLRDQEIQRESRPRPAETEQKLSRPILFRELNLQLISTHFG